MCIRDSSKYKSGIDCTYTKYFLPSSPQQERVHTEFPCEKGGVEEGKEMSEYGLKSQCANNQQYKPQGFLYKVFNPEIGTVLGNGRLKDDLYRKECLEIVKDEKKQSKSKQNMFFNQKRANRNNLKYTKLRAISYQAKDHSFTFLPLGNYKATASNNSRRKDFAADHSTNLIFAGRSIGRMWNHHFVELPLLGESFVAEAKSSLLLPSQIFKEEFEAQALLKTNCRAATFSDNILNIIKKPQFPRPNPHSDESTMQINRRHREAEELIKEEVEYSKLSEEKVKEKAGIIMEISNYMTVLHSSKYKVIYNTTVVHSEVWEQLSSSAKCASR
eukprot:TRINITY_DN5636_c0_g2_i2.p1 TRINITY_DN5636_c0_g2~~TRINITY_DN5636_c0_g2_i2.p1  ORF type:complete len:330 (+),score=62.02 TRINITY_DN5636_c0_g2_i2:77-1066(+)